MSSPPAPPPQQFPADPNQQFPGQPFPAQGQPFPAQGQQFPGQGQQFPGQPFPAQGQPFPPPGPSPAARPAAPRRRRFGRLAVTLLIVAAIAAGGWFFSRNDAAKAQVGDCMAQTGSDSLEVVDCSDAKAEFRVVGRVEGKTQIEATVSVSTVCDAYQDQGAEQVYWEGEQGKKGLVLCLAKK